MYSTDPVIRCERSAELLTIHLSGELDCATTDDLRDQIVAHVGDAPRVVLDVTGVTFCSSSGLTLFIQVHTHLRDRGGDLTLHGPVPSVLRSIEMCRLDQVLTITPALTALT